MRDAMCGSGEAHAYLDVPVGNAELVAEVHGHDELLEQASRTLLRQRTTLQQNASNAVQLGSSQCHTGNRQLIAAQVPCNTHQFSCCTIIINAGTSTFSQSSQAEAHLGDHAVLDVLGEVAAVGVLQDERHVVLRHEHLVQLDHVRVPCRRTLQEARGKTFRTMSHIAQQRHNGVA